MDSSAMERPCALARPHAGEQAAGATLIVGAPEPKAMRARECASGDVVHLAAPASPGLLVVLVAGVVRRLSSIAAVTLAPRRAAPSIVVSGGWRAHISNRAPSRTRKQNRGPAGREAGRIVRAQFRGPNRTNSRGKEGSARRIRTAPGPPLESVSALSETSSETECLRPPRAASYFSVDLASNAVLPALGRDPLVRIKVVVRP
jgi:hypothetical protein